MFFFNQQNIAQAIVKSEDAKEFASLGAEVASTWLETDPGPAGRLFRSFISRHGHRGVKEFDVATETWGMNSLSLISVLQSMVANPSAGLVSTPKSKDDWLDTIGHVKPSISRALKFFVPKSRDGVVAREKTKSMLIRTIHVFRTAYRRLARLLVRDGKIPDANLVFYFTHLELQQLIRSNGAALINKAVRRRKLYPQLDSLVFPEISLGVPKPVQNSAEDLVHF